MCSNRKHQFSEYFVPKSKGIGKYAYLDASFPRQHGDNVRLLSPMMQGGKCMSFMYHMHGTFMGSLVIYMKTNGTERVEWIKTGNHPNQWFEAVIFLNSSTHYQVILWLIWIEKVGYNLIYFFLCLRHLDAESVNKFK